MPDEEQKNEQPPMSPGELPTPMPQPVEQSSELAGELPKPVAEEPVAIEQSSPEPVVEQEVPEPPVAEPVEASTPTPIEVSTEEETPAAQPTVEAQTAEEPVSTPESELNSLPPAEAPMPTFADEEPIAAQNPFVTAQTVHPDTSENAATSMTAAQAPVPVNKKRSKKGIILGIVITILVVLIGGAASGYFLWYQNPNKVVMDTIVNTITAESAAYIGSMAFTSETADVIVEVNGQINQDATDNTVKVTITSKEETDVDVGAIIVNGRITVAKDGTIYLKLHDLKGAYEKFRDALVQASLEEYAAKDQALTSEEIASTKAVYDTFLLPTVEKLDNQWIKSDAAGLEDTSGAADNSLTCVSDAFKKAVDSGTFTGEIVSAYERNAFLVVSEDLGVQNGSQGYVLIYDDVKADAFTAATENTQLAKDVMSCNADEDMTTADDAETMSDVKRIELWTDRFSHTLTRLVVEASDDESRSTTKVDISTVLNGDTNIEIPSDAKTLEEVLGAGTDNLLFNLLGESANSY